MALQDANNYVVVPAGTAGNTAITTAGGIRLVTVILWAAVATAAIALWDGPVGTGTQVASFPIGATGPQQVNIPIKTALNVAGAGSNVGMTFIFG